MMQTIDERVAKGAAWLDEEHPGWRENIDPEILDMTSCLSCILGQVYENYWWSPITKRWTDADDRKAAAMGFNIDFNLTGDEVEAEFKLLTESWLRELAR